MVIHLHLFKKKKENSTNSKKVSQIIFRVLPLDLQYHQSWSFCITTIGSIPLFVDYYVSYAIVSPVHKLLHYNTIGSIHLVVEC